MPEKDPMGARQGLATLLVTIAMVACGFFGAFAGLWVGRAISPNSNMGDLVGVVYGMLVGPLIALIVGLAIGLRHGLGWRWALFTLAFVVVVAASWTFFGGWGR